jgi:hypothetical protein
MTGIGRTICLGLCFAPVVFGAPPWTKPATGWTRQDATRILTRSPWAKPVAMHDASGAQRLIVRWEDALPIKEALGKIGVEPAAANSASYYAVAVVLPRTADGIHDWTKARASLKATGNTACDFAEVRGEKLPDGTQLVIFLFPKTLEIGEARSFRLPLLTVHSRSIEFEAQTGTARIRQSFPIQDLFYLGKFEL